MLRKIFSEMDQRIRDLNHRRIDWMRAARIRIVFKLLTHLQRMSRATFKKVKTAEASNGILVMRLDDKIGDGVAATGFLREIKKNFAKDRLIVLTRKNSAFVYENLDYVDEVFIMKRGGWATFLVYWYFRNFYFRYVINTSHILTPQVLFLSFFLKSTRQLTFFNEFSSIFSDSVRYDQSTDHITVRYSKVLNRLGVENPTLDYELPFNINPTAQKIVDQLRSKFKTILILNSFAGARLRNLNQQTTRAIVQGILETKPDVLVLSIGSRDDQSILDQWIAEARSDSDLFLRWVSFPEVTTLQANIELVRLSDLIVTPDTSWVHIASAFKIPLVAIFREDDGFEKNSVIWAPYKTNFRVVFARYDFQRPHDINTVDCVEVIKNIQSQLLSLDC